MTTRPTRETTAGRAYLDLRKLARERSRPTAELQQLFALEGFLARLPLSPHAQRFILKGGVLLAAFNARRPTKDIDFAAMDLANDTETIRDAIRAVLRVELNDGLIFDFDSTKAETTREDDDYSGVRVTVPCRLASAKLDFHVDVNVGDPIWPGPSTVSIPRVLGGDPLGVRGYPITMVLAEKIVTAMQRGIANTRWRDFADIAVLSRQHTLDAKDFVAAIDVVARHRLVDRQPLRVVLAGFAATAQPRWLAWRRRIQLEETLPESFSALLEELFVFVDPVLTSMDLGKRWNPGTGAWGSREEPETPTR